jgi:hypothetical protein
VAPSLGTLIGLHGVASVVPLCLLLAVVIGVVLWRGKRDRLLTTAGAVVVAAPWIGAFRLAPRTFDLPTRRDYLARLWTPGRF